MQTEETRALIKTYYETLPTGNREKLASLFTEDIVWHPPESAPIDDSSSFFSEEDALSLLSELIDLNPSGLIDDESLLLADLSDPTSSAQPATEYSVEATDLVADLSMADYYDDIMHNDILVGVSELG